MDFSELKGKIYFRCTTCMSVWADALSWVNKRDRAKADAEKRFEKYSKKF